MIRLFAFALSGALVGCRAGSSTADGAPSAAPSTMARASAHPPAPRASGTNARASGLELQRFRLASAVEKREPVDELTAAAPGQRVWAHATIRNRTGAKRRVSLVFRVDGDERSTVDLQVETSWSWRTWGYVTLRPEDRSGVLTVELRDEGGELLAQKALTIREGAAPANSAKRP